MLYERTPVAKSKLGRVTEVTADIGLMAVLSRGAGLRGLKFVIGSATSGFVLGSIEATPDGQLSTRLRNGIIGAGEGLVGGYVVDKAIKIGKVLLPQFVAKIKSIGNSHRIEEVSGSKIPLTEVNVPPPRVSKPPISHEIIEPLLFSGGVRNKQSLNTILSKNVETTHARSMVDALRLNVELSLRQANILNEKGELTSRSRKG